MKKSLENTFKNKKVLILGMGIEGQSTLRFIQKFFPGTDFSTADKKDGNGYLDNLRGFDLIIKSPGISWNIKEIKQAKESGVEFTSQTQIFLDIFKDQTIGITGTKGKSTTSSLIYNILNTSGKKVKLVGNIGKPVLDYIENFDDESLFVYEMSSHQLSDITQSPHIAVFLNIFPEHLDYYSSFEEYLRAKENITKFQNENDIFIYCSDFPDLIKIADKSKAKKYNFSSEHNLDEYGVKISDNPLLGNHNLNNIKAAILVARSLEINDSDIKNGIETFTPLDDRLQTIKMVNSISFIDDSLATIPQATIAALDSYQNKKVTLILGGFDRGVDFTILGKYLKENKNVINVILIGQTSNKIQEILETNNFAGKINNLHTSTMKDVVELAYKITPTNGVVLLSPAATSFDMFKDYKDRAEQFKKAVLDL